MKKAIAIIILGINVFLYLMGCWLNSPGINIYYWHPIGCLILISLDIIAIGFWMILHRYNVEQHYLEQRKELRDTNRLSKEEAEIILEYRKQNDNRS